MKTHTIAKQFICILFGILLLAACSDNDSPTAPEPEPATGAVEINTTTTGPDPDDYGDGYTITVNGTNGGSADTTGTVIINGLEEGLHEIELTGVLETCAVENDNPQAVTVTARDTTSVSFEVSCKEVLKNQIVFFSNRGGQFGLYLMEPNGTGVKKITTETDPLLSPDISPDGTKIAYTQPDGTNTQNGNIWVMNADGSEPVQLTKSGEDREPDWSPDGTQIAFTSVRDGNDEIYVMNTQGTELKNLTNHPDVDRIPEWSPDGTKIAFTTTREEGAKIFTMDPEGENLQNLSGSFDRDANGAWSPDGSQLVFGSEESGVVNLHVMDANGENRRQITNFSTRILYVSSYPSWSADGTKIVFSSELDGDDIDVYTINADGTGVPANLTVNSESDSHADWSPVGEETAL